MYVYIVDCYSYSKVIQFTLESNHLIAFDALQTCEFEGLIEGLAVELLFIWIEAGFIVEMRRFSFNHFHFWLLNTTKKEKTQETH